MTKPKLLFLCFSFFIFTLGFFISGAFHDVFAACGGTCNNCSNQVTNTCSNVNKNCTTNTDCEVVINQCYIDYTYGQICNNVPSFGTCDPHDNIVCSVNNSCSSCIASQISCHNLDGSFTHVTCGGSGPVCTYGAWSTCSLTCGGGTQTRTDNCNHTDTRACNTQACAPSGGGGPTCNPSCGTSCGQGDGCGGTCSSSDTAAPGAVTGQTPPDGSSVTVTNNTVSLNWSAATNASLYEVQVYPLGTPAGQECTAANTHCPSASSGTSYSFGVDAGVASYTWRVRAINSRCSPSTIGAWTTPISFTFGAGLAGNFYQDDTNQAVYNYGSQQCELTGAALTTPPVGSTIRATWNGGANSQTGTITDATFAIANVGYDPVSTNIFFTPVSPYTCTCPVGCSYSGQTAPKSGIPFFISPNRTAWWQTGNGLLYGGATTGQAVVSQVPTTCTTPTCTPAISLKNRNGATDSEGYVISGGGTIDSTYDPNTQYSDLRQDGLTGHIASNKIRGPIEDYPYFIARYSMGSSPTADPMNGAKPTAAPVNGRAYYVNGAFTVSSAWSVAAGESYVVFVNGNLSINQPITVAEGGFLAFIVNGNITVDPAVGQASPTSTTPVVEGVYIAQQQLIIASNLTSDLKFVGAGSFTAWGGVQLSRQYTPASANNTAPTDLFYYRPDFILTIPPRMTNPYTLWQETNL
jgi:hypothetical protein